MKLKLSSRQKVAILMVALPQEIATQILREFETLQAQEIVGEIARLPKISPEVRDEVVNEFLSNYRPSPENNISYKLKFDFPCNLVYKNLLEERDRGLYKKILDKKGCSENYSQERSIKPLEFLSHLEAGEIAALLRKDHPRTIALVIYYMKPLQASKVLKELRMSLQIEVSKRLAEIQKVAPEILSEIENVLQERLKRLMSGEMEYREIDGREVLMNILSMCDSRTEERILRGIMRKYPGLAKDLKRNLCDFDDLRDLDNEELIEVIRLADIRDLLLVLRGGDKEITEKIFHSMAPESVKLLKEDLENLSLSSIDEEEIKTARQKIRNILRGLISLGKVNLKKTSAVE